MLPPLEIFQRIFDLFWCYGSLPWIIEAKNKKKHARVVSPCVCAVCIFECVCACVCVSQCPIWLDWHCVKRSFLLFSIQPDTLPVWYNVMQSSILRHTQFYTHAHAHMQVCTDTSHHIHTCRHCRFCHRNIETYTLYLWVFSLWTHSDTEPLGLTLVAAGPPVGQIQHHTSPCWQLFFFLSLYLII